MTLVAPATLQPPITPELLAERTAERRREAALIDPETAYVFWETILFADPYGDGIDIPLEKQCFGPEFFAKRPDGEIWIDSNDLPEATLHRLWERMRAGDPTLSQPRPPSDDDIPF